MSYYKHYHKSYHYDNDCCHRPYHRKHYYDSLFYEAMWECDRYRDLYYNSLYQTDFYDPYYRTGRRL